MGSGGPPKYTRRHIMGGGTGSRVMPGPQRLPKNGVKDVYSVLYNPQGSNASNYPKGTNSNYTTVAKQTAIGGSLNRGIITLHWSVGGIGGGPNEPGTNANVINTPNGGWIAQYPTALVTYTNAAGSTITYNTNQSHYRHTDGAYVNLDSRFDQFNVPFGFEGSFQNNNPDAVRNAATPYSTGGGGWGSAGGSWYGSANQVDGIGGAGGPAVKTNGNAVTFTGGQGTDRVFGAIA